jgi:hypothetical protein
VNRGIFTRVKKEMKKHEATNVGSALKIEHKKQTIFMGEDMEAKVPFKD